MNRHQTTVGAAVAALTLCGVIVILAGHQTVEAPSYAMGQQFEAGRLIVNLPHPLTHRFEFRNTSDQRLEISAIKPSCGCTRVDAPVRSFEPGESGWIEATANLHASGPFATEVAIHWSTGEKTQYTIGAFAQIERDLSLSAMSVDIDVAEPRTLLLTYIDQAGREPGPVELESTDAINVEVGPWQTIIEANKAYGIAARYSATVQVELTRSIEEVSHVSFSLASQPELRRAELTVRTPALVRTYAMKHRSDRPSTGPIVIDHEMEPGADPESSASDRP